MPNPLYPYLLDIYYLVWLGFMTYQPMVGYLMSNLLYTCISKSKVGDHSRG